MTRDEKRKINEVKAYMKSKSFYIIECSNCGEKKQSSDMFKEELAALVLKQGWQVVLYKNKILCPECYEEDRKESSTES